MSFTETSLSFCRANPSTATMLADNDAALLIGDPALRYRFDNQLPNAENEKGIIRDGAEPVQVFDLMERWNNLTGLPFVFAFWAARKGYSDSSVADGLIESRAFGLENLDTIAERYEEKLGIEKAFLLDYLKKNMDYHMDSDGVAALEQFYQMAGLGWCAQVRPWHRVPVKSSSDILKSAIGGTRVSDVEAAQLLMQADLLELGEAADTIRRNYHENGVVSLHHRPERQLYERVQRVLQLLRFLPSRGAPGGVHNSERSYF